MEKRFTKAATIVRDMDRGNAPVFELIRCFQQGERDRKSGRSFTSCQYKDARMVKAWEEGWHSAKKP